MVGADALDVARGAADRRGLVHVRVALALQRKVDARVRGVLQDALVRVRGKDRDRVRVRVRVKVS